MAALQLMLTVFTFFILVESLPEVIRIGESSFIKLIFRIFYMLTKSWARSVLHESLNDGTI